MINMKKTLDHRPYDMYQYRLQNILKEAMKIYDIYIIDDCVKLHELLTLNNHDNQNKLYFNDCDNCSWYIPHDSYKIMCIEAQCLKCMVIIEEEEVDYLGTGLNIQRQVTIYTYYNEFNPEEHDWDDEVTDTTVTIKYFLKHQTRDDSYYYSDDIDENDYISFPKIQTILDKINDNKRVKGRCYFSPLLRLDYGAIWYALEYGKKVEFQGDQLSNITYFCSNLGYNLEHFDKPEK